MGLCIDFPKIFHEITNLVLMLGLFVYVLTGHAQVAEGPLIAVALGKPADFLSERRSVGALLDSRGKVYRTIRSALNIYAYDYALAGDNKTLAYIEYSLQERVTTLVVAGSEGSRARLYQSKDFLSSPYWSADQRSIAVGLVVYGKTSRPTKTLTATTVLVDTISGKATILVAGKVPIGWLGSGRLALLDGSGRISEWKIATKSARVMDQATMAAAVLSDQRTLVVANHKAGHRWIKIATKAKGYKSAAAFEVRGAGAYGFLQGPQGKGLVFTRYTRAMGPGLAEDPEVLLFDYETRKLRIIKKDATTGGSTEGAWSAFTLGLLTRRQPAAGRPRS